jgi:AcrR family transcriptional regulator
VDSMARSAVEPRLGSTPYSAAQRRIIAAALLLFADRGVSGTSLQMIADEIGVTKAAVYHQFKTKEAIVVAAVEVELGRLEAALESAESANYAPNVVETLLAQVINLAVARRRMVSTLQHDPVVVRLLANQPPFQQFMDRLNRALLGEATDPQARLRVAMIASAIGGAVTHPLVADLDDEALRSGLLELAERFFEAGRPPPPKSRGSSL